MTEDLITWLRAQLEEDERLIAAAGTTPLAGLVVNWPRQAGKRTAWDFVARFTDMELLRREVEAHQKIIDECLFRLEEDDRGTDPCAAKVLSLLASIYSDRPGFRQEWAP